MTAAWVIAAWLIASPVIALIYGLLAREQFDDEEYDQ